MAEAALRCRADAPFLQELRELYRQVDEAVAAIRGVCWGGGACCKFDLMGHRLYLSSGELALLSQQAPADLSRCLRGRCPYQSGPHCLARQVRPLGCRTFFCSPRLKDLINETYESFHLRIRLAHQRRCLPYAYAELTKSIYEMLATM